MTIDVKNVIVDTWQPNPEVRSSNRSDLRAQMDLCRSGESKGNALDNGSVGRGRHVPDYHDSSVNQALLKQVIATF